MLSNTIATSIKNRGLTLTIRWDEIHQKWLATLYDTNAVFLAQAHDNDVEMAVCFAVFQFLLSTQNEESFKQMQNMVAAVAGESLPAFPAVNQ